MPHGSAAYFEERARNGRRIAGLSLAVGLVLLAPVVVLRTTPLGQRVHDIPLLQFGFAGPPRYVELMQVDARPSNMLESRDIGRVVVRTGRSGNPGKPGRPAVRGVGVTAVPLPGVMGESGNDLMARALASQGRVPVMQSSDLVIDKLVRPEYPEDAQRRGVEGRVAILARVDTLGEVPEAQVMNPSGEPAMDDAALRAVLGCRFRPYRQDGKLTEVYAVFRFAFRIY